MADQPPADGLPDYSGAAASEGSGTVDPDHSPFADKPTDAASETMTADSIDELLRQAGTFTDAAGAIPQAPESAPSTDAAADTSPFGGAGGLLPDQESIEELLRQASFDEPAPMPSAPARQTAAAPANAYHPAVPDAPPFRLPDFEQAIQDAQVSSIDLLRDVELNVKIELGRSRMLVEDVLRLSEGSVVELDKLAGDPVDVFVNERLVARGEVLVLNDNFCVRVNEIVSSGRDEGM